MYLKRSLSISVAAAVLACTATARSADTSAPARLFDSPEAAEPGAGLQSAAPAAVAPRPVGTPLVTASQPFVLAPPPAEAATAQTPPEIDLSALRYFAGQNDLSRVAAEIRRIRLKHPDWQAPEDLFSAAGGGGAQEAPLWQMFAKADYAGVRAGIAELQAANPDWRPSSDLLGKLALAEGYQSLKTASDSHDWPGVLQAAAQNRMLLTCGYVDALWRTAEALVKSEDEPRATEAYRYVLTNCQKPEDRLATVQKANALLKSTDSLEQLMALGRRQPNGRNEFESVRLDRLRKTIGEAAADPASPPVAPAQIDVLATRARSGDLMQGDQQLLGWYFYARKDYAQAENWFRLANQPNPTPKAAEGLVLTLRAAGKLEEAGRLAIASARLGPANEKLVVEAILPQFDDAKAPPASPETIAAFIHAVDDTHHAEGAQRYGWRLYDAKDVAGARAWFVKSSEWGDSEGAAIGLVVTAQRLGDKAALAQATAKYGATYPKVAELAEIFRKTAAKAPTLGARRGESWDASATAIVNSLQAANYDDTLARLDARRQTHGSESPGLLIVRGWALLNKGKLDLAREAFLQAQSRGLRREADEGLAQVAKAPRYLFSW